MNDDKAQLDKAIEVVMASPYHIERMMYARWFVRIWGDMAGCKPVDKWCRGDTRWILGGKQS